MPSEFHEEYWRMVDGRLIAVGEMEVEHLRLVLRQLLGNARMRVSLRKQLKANGSTPPSREKVAALLRTKMAVLKSEPLLGDEE